MTVESLLRVNLKGVRHWETDGRNSVLFPSFFNQLRVIEIRVTGRRVRMRWTVIDVICFARLYDEGSVLAAWPIVDHTIFVIRMRFYNDGTTCLSIGVLSVTSIGHLSVNDGASFFNEVAAVDVTLDARACLVGADLVLPGVLFVQAEEIVSGAILPRFHAEIEVATNEIREFVDSAAVGRWPGQI